MTSTTGTQRVLFRFSLFALLITHEIPQKNLYDQTAMKSSEKILVITGPTASGKSDLAIALAKKYDGEIISADSRQVYRGMDIGSGKVARDNVSCHPEQREGSRNDKTGNTNAEIPHGVGNDKCFYSENIRHHLLDVADPKRSYNVTHFVRDAKKAVKDIRKRGKLPIICGGTGFWIQALVEDESFPPVKPNLKLRATLSKKNPQQLFELLEKKDPVRAQTIDQKNPVRLIRALEICEALGHVPIPSRERLDYHKEFTIIALCPEKEVLQKNIHVRLEKRFKKGMIQEVENLRVSGISWKRLQSFGLEYKNIALFLQGKLSREKMIEQLEHEIRHYAKRQLTWLRRFEKMGAKINWIKNSAEAEKALQLIIE